MHTRITVIILCWGEGGFSYFSAVMSSIMDQMKTGLNINNFHFLFGSDCH